MWVGELRVHLDYHNKIGKAYFLKIFSRLKFCNTLAISFPFTVLEMIVECLQWGHGWVWPVLCFLDYYIFFIFTNP